MQMSRGRLFQMVGAARLQAHRYHCSCCWLRQQWLVDGAQML